MLSWEVHNRLEEHPLGNVALVELGHAGIYQFSPGLLSIPVNSCQWPSWPHHGCSVTRFASLAVLK